MIAFLRKDRWSPYLVGALIGCLLCALMAIGQYIGVSTGVARVGALVEYYLNEEHVMRTPYFKKLLRDGIIFNWKILFLAGLFVGAFIAAQISSAKRPNSHTIWQSRFGKSKVRRNVTAFLGGFLLLFGSRLADGCTSGHAISGGAQLSLTSWAFMLAVFVAAIPTSFLIYRK